MKNLKIIFVLLTLSSCTTPSAYTDLKYLTGEPDPKEKAATIFDALKRDADLQKEQMSKLSGKMTKYSTGVNIEMAPFTQPLVIARAREKFEDQAFKEKWSNEKKDGEISKYIKSFSPKKSMQCFDMEIRYNTSVAIDGYTPKELNLEYWYASVNQEGKKTKLQFDKNPTCLITTTREVTSYGVSTNRKYVCPTAACAEVGLDLTKPFQVEFDIRYEKDLLPLVLEWKGIKE